MNWLVTGGSGQLGMAVSEELGSRDLVFTALGSRDLDITDNKKVKEFICVLSSMKCLSEFKQLEV